VSRVFRQWNVVLVPYPHPEQPHYLVVLSPDWVAGNSDFRTLNGLICHTIRPPDRPPRAHEVFLDTADGLDHKTVCRCHTIVEFVREKVLPLTGRISTVRQLAIRRKVREICGL
jgi:hypothetical protein